MDAHTLNAVYTAPQMRRRYEVWFLRCGLADGSGAWWFRYLLLNPGKNGCNSQPSGMPVQVWATWFPRNGKPRTFIEGFPFQAAAVSPRGRLPFFFRIADCGIENDACWGALHVEGHSISWKLSYRSDFAAVLSDKGWIGFSRSPHSNAVFSGEILFDDERFAADPLGFGVQGHNSGYRHRTYWRWLHASFLDARGAPSAIEALAYDLPFGMVFRNAVWYHHAKPSALRRIQETEIVNQASHLRWSFRAQATDRSPFEITAESFAPEIHHLPYTRTDCHGSFPVANASLARAQIRFGPGLSQSLETTSGAVLEMGGA